MNKGLVNLTTVLPPVTKPTKNKAIKIVSGQSLAVIQLVGDLYHGPKRSQAMSACVMIGKGQREQDKCNGSQDTLLYYG